jgi:hypothetical protein
VKTGLHCLYLSVFCLTTWSISGTVYGNGVIYSHYFHCKGFAVRADSAVLGSGAESRDVHVHLI